MLKEQSAREEFASRMLEEAIQFLKAQSPSERNKDGIEIARKAASFLLEKSLFHELEQIWANIPRKDDGAGKHFPELMSIDSPLHEYKVMLDEEFLAYLQELAPERFEVCSTNDLSLEEVLQTAKSSLDIEQVGRTYAALGKYEQAIKVANLPNLEKFRQEGVLWIIQMEKLRRGDFDSLDFSFIKSGIHPWHAGCIAICALGRILYMGYPYSKG